MTKQGEGIRDAISQIRKLHTSVALLLRTVDAAMSGNSWTNARNDNAALHELSYSIDNPAKWMPKEVFRFYKSDRYPTVICSVAVMLDDDNGKISEPLIVVTVFDFGAGEAPPQFKTWYSVIYKGTPGARADGKVFDILPSHLEKGWESSFQKSFCFAIPLVDVSSESDLKQMVVDRIAKEVEQFFRSDARIR